MTRGYETKDVRYGPVIGFTVALVAVILAVLLIVGFIEERFVEREKQTSPGPHPMRAFQAPIREPRLQANPRLETDDMRRRDATRTEHYGWVDRTGELVQIPVERAMQILAERGGDRADLVRDRVTESEK